MVLKSLYTLLATALTLGLLINISPNKFPKIPGDIYLDKLGFRIYIPFTSAVIVSILILALLNFVAK